MYALLRHMDERELRFCWAWLERQCLNRVGDVPAMERFERRLTEVKTEVDRRRYESNQNS